MLSQKTAKCDDQFHADAGNSFGNLADASDANRKRPRVRPISEDVARPPKRGGEQCGLSRLRQIRHKLGEPAADACRG